MKTAFLLSSLLLFFTLTQVFGQGNDLRLEPVMNEIPLPCSGSPIAFSLSQGPDNSVMMVWLEKIGGEAQIIRIAGYSALRSKWDNPRSIASSTVLMHPAHLKELALSVGEAGRMAVVWTGVTKSGDDTPQIYAAFAEDGGATWKAPILLSTPNRAASHASLAWRQDGSWTATWLEDSEHGASQVCTREAGQDAPLRFEGATALSSVATWSASFPDGTGLIGYRSFAPEEGCDPWIIRRFDGSWQAPQRLGREGWKGTAPTQDSVRFSVSAPRVAMAWFTAADDEPRVLVSSSPDAGARWTQASRVDLGRAVGAPDIALLRDGSMLLAWIEGPGFDQSLPSGILLRRYAPGGGTVRPAYMVKDEPRNFQSGPRLAILRDNPGEPVELMMAFEQGTTSSLLHLLRLQMPSPEALQEIDSSCRCNNSALPGFPIRGRILSVDTKHSSMRIGHDAIPGIFRRGELEVQVPATVLAAMREGRGVMGRIERQGDKWLMSDVRTYSIP